MRSSYAIWILENINALIQNSVNRKFKTNQKFVWVRLKGSFLLSLSLKLNSFVDNMLNIFHFMALNRSFSSF